MDFKTNVWDDHQKWNSLIHPQMGKLRPFDNGKKSIRRE